VTPQEAGKVLEGWLDVEGEVIVAMRRFGDLRFPNELLALKWSDVNGEQSHFTIRSSKTEPHFRQSNMSLRTQLERIILQAGLKHWP
jgi:integrase